MMQFWNELEGQTIDGRHPLRRLVRSEGRRAWFETEAGDPQKTAATISLTEALTDADEVSDRLRAAQGLTHPNLVNILKVGQVDLDGTLFVYAVMEHIEQSLSDVLETQALSADEAREVAEALVGSLTAIHQKGMSHGHVEAASVLATEETVKLRSDCLQSGAAGQGDDVAGVGATLFHAFTQRKGITATDAQINRIPAPYAEIVRNTFARRWTLAQVGNALKPVAPVLEPLPPAIPAPVVAKPVEKVAAKEVPVKATPPAPAVATPRPVAPPVAVTAPLAPPAELIDMEEGPPKIARAKLPLYLGLAVLAVLVILGWLILRPGSGTPKEASTPAAAPVVAEKPVPPPAQAAPNPAPAKKPSAAVPLSHSARAALASAAVAGETATATATATNGRPVWRVIAYTYRFKQPAADMAAKISGQHPNLTAEVFSPHSKKDVYLVSLGGAMDHAAAVKMLDKVRSMGLPHDTFIQNYAE